MKKVLLALGFVLAFTTSVFAEVILAPQWSEFCPAEYLTVQSSKFSSAKTYWYNRRIQFDASISRCVGYKGDDLKSCYEQIRQAEATKNLQWQEKQMREQAEFDRAMEYNNTMNTFHSINSLIDKIH